MIDFAEFGRPPIVVAIAGPNGAGKSTFFESHVAASGLRFVNADLLANEHGIDAYASASLADSIRRALVERGESFAFETVFSDPVGDKVAFLEETARRGYTVVLCYVGIAGPDQSIDRVAMRALQGGHVVPIEKLRSRFSRTLDNLRAAIVYLPHVLIYDNSDLALPFRHVAVFDHGEASLLNEPLPEWLRPLVP
ncbi:MAG TPA: zeta toxin family protein [Pirellulales bacterium]|nr:zeta toxin family protein [Pirellulales bacterium]